MTFLVPKFLQGVGAPLPQYSAQTMRLMLAEQWDEGVLGGLRVSQRAAGANFTVDIGAGECVIEGDDFTGQGNYEGESTGVENRTVTAAPGSGTRHDIVVARINDEQAGGPTTNDMTLEIITGTVGAGPPAVPPTALLLATLGPIVSSTPSIIDSLIVDDRVWAGRRATPGTVEAVHHTRGVAGWLDADGSTVNTADYPRLADILGQTGVTMVLPDHRGRFLVGANGPAGNDRVAGVAVGGTGGESSHTLTVAEMPSHAHGGTLQAGAHVHNLTNATEVWRGQSGPPLGDGVGSSDAGDLFTLGMQSAGTHSHSIPFQGDGVAHNTRPPYGAVRWLIRT